MNLHTKPFGKPADNTEVTLFILSNANGVKASLMNYAATLVALEAPDRNGKLADVALGFDTLGGYIDFNSPYFGCIVGRCANRIANGRFQLDGKEYRLATNAGNGHLHGGRKGFDKAFWDAEALLPSVKFTYHSSDGEEGYPGNLTATVTYTLNENNELSIEYSAAADKPTPVNLTNHTYFNLAGSGTILGHELLIASTRYLPVNDALLPTGEIHPVKGTPMDFTTSTPIGGRIRQLKSDPVGYDHTYVLENDGRKIKLAARVSEPQSGRVLEVYTTEPGVQFYTGNFLDGTISGKGGRAYHQHTGFCLETQHFPDSVNQPTFPSVILKPGQQHRQKTIYRLGAQQPIIAASSRS
jgi:aldose 1-epimerase